LLHQDIHPIFVRLGVKPAGSGSGA